VKKAADGEEKWGVKRTGRQRVVNVDGVKERGGMEVVT